MIQLNTSKYVHANFLEMIYSFHCKIVHCSIVSQPFFAMAFLGFLSINRAIEVYMLVLFGLNCLQMLDFKYSVGLSSNLLSFSIVRKYFKTCAILDEDSTGVRWVYLI